MLTPTDTQIKNYLKAFTQICLNNKEDKGYERQIVIKIFKVHTVCTFFSFSKLVGAASSLLNTLEIMVVASRF